MIDGNISMEEDTELRDLVVQTLENNGVLAKVRAELRASVFLTLEEQESVLNPEPFLNKTVKQYLACPEGKLLFSLVREFLEYFKLEYTLSVFDPETYFGKEYDYLDRKKLSEELGIHSKEPLLGEILKNAINNALNVTEKSNNSNAKLSQNVDNTTFDISNPVVLQVENVDANNLSNKIDSLDSNLLSLTENTVSNKNCELKNVNNKHSKGDISGKVTFEKQDNQRISLIKGQSVFVKTDNDSSNSVSSKTNSNSEIETNQEIIQSQKNHSDLQTFNNVNNIKQSEFVKEKTNTYDQIKLDKLKKIVKKTALEDSLTGKLQSELPSLKNSRLGDLPPLNDKKVILDDLKELMDIAQGVSDVKDTTPLKTEDKDKDKDSLQDNTLSENSTSHFQLESKLDSQNDPSEEIEEEISSTISCDIDLLGINKENSCAAPDGETS